MLDAGAWVVDATIREQQLVKGDYLYFGLRVGVNNWNYDATEVAFTIDATINDLVAITAVNPNAATIPLVGPAEPVQIVLTAKPAADVVIRLATTGTAAVTLSSAAVTFTPLNWNVAQTVTIIGRSGPGALSTGTASVLASSVTSQDVEFDGVTVNPAASYVVNFRP